MPVEETLIVADNDSMMRGLLRTVLEQPKRRLLLCADGREAVELASQTLATLILLDLKMPRMGGIDAARLIRGIPRYAKVPIVILTVFDGENIKREALRAGVTAFVAKPFSRAELLRVIDPLIEAQKQAMELERS